MKEKQHSMILSVLLDLHILKKYIKVTDIFFKKLIALSHLGDVLMMQSIVKI